MGNIFFSQRKEKKKKYYAMGERKTLLRYYMTFSDGIEALL